MDDEVSGNNKKGYKVKIKKNSSAHSWKLPIYCPREECRMITSNLDDETLRSYGVCLHCYITFIENREKPLINVEFYKNRLKERGY